MNSTLSPARADPHRDGDEVVLAPSDWTGAHQAPSRVAQEAVGTASNQAESDIFARLQVTEPALNETLRPADPKHDRFPSDRPSLAGRASRALARFLMAVFLGVAATLVWQSYGEAAKQMIARWAPQLGWSLSLPATNPPPGPLVAEPSHPSAEQASTQEAAQTPPSAQSAPEMVAPIAPAGPSSDPQQLEAIARDLAAVRQSIERLAAGQEQIARNIAKAEQGIRQRISAPPPQPAAAPARKPVQVPPQSPPPISAAPPTPALPSAPLRPTMP